ncbi:IS3 family transposase [Streptomyces hirsutus]|uniref:IS3 family transposase n=1 Tax=Streptomyces hirsutus TaxID=35620 RepID=UPI0036B0BAA4
MGAFSTSLTTTVFSQRGMWRFETPPRRAVPNGLPSSSTQHCFPRGSYLHSTPLFSHSWHTDITYIATGEGWLYLATWLDLATREIVGYSMADHHRAGLVVDALKMAAGRGQLKPGCIAHSDRGSEYTSDELRREIGRLGLRQSMGRTGSCFDNAAAESFFALLKEEIGTRRWPDRSSARADIFAFVETFYNRQRLRRHPRWGYLTPLETRQRLEQEHALVA